MWKILFMAILCNKYTLSTVAHTKLERLINAQLTKMWHECNTHWQKHKENAMGV